jgi:hypothetical protein
MPPYSVDILYNAIDNSRMGTLSFLKQIESVDRAVQSVEAGGKQSGVETRGDTSDRFFAGLTKRFLAVEALQAGMHGVSIAANLWNYEQSKVTNSLSRSLDQQMKIRESVYGLVRDLPFVGRLAVEVFDAFRGGKAPLEQMKNLVENIERSLVRSGEVLDRMRSGNRLMELENRGAPASEKEADSVQNARKAREKELRDAAVNVGTANTAYQIQRKREEDAAAMRSAMANTYALGPSDFVTYDPDRTESNKAAEKLKQAQRRLADLQAEENRARVNEQDRINKMRSDEAAKAAAEREKKFEDERKKGIEIYDWNRDQSQRIEELQARQVKGRSEREKKEIEIKYKYEIQRAREAGRDIRYLEEQRRIELEGVTPDSRPGQMRSGSGFPAQEMRFANNSRGYGAENNYQRDIAGNSKRQSELLKKLNQGMDRLVQAIISPQNNRPMLSDY